MSSSGEIEPDISSQRTAAPYNLRENPLASTSGGSVVATPLTVAEAQRLLREDEEIAIIVDDNQPSASGRGMDDERVR